MADEITNEELFGNPADQRAYEEFCAQQESVESFQLDKPALVCRWRMSRRKVPMLNRHIRALSQRLVQGKPLTNNMLSWAKQHVEWSLDAGDYDDPNGVLMLVIDINGNAAMTVGSYEPLPASDHDALYRRAETARTEQAETGVAPEVLCCVQGGSLYVGAAAGEHVCGTMTLVEQLAKTRGHEVRRAVVAGDADAALSMDDLPGAHLLVSDEHGVVVESGGNADASDREFAEFLAEGLQKLFK